MINVDLKRLYAVLLLHLLTGAMQAADHVV